MRERLYYAFIMESRSGVLYIGVTNDLARRVCEPKHGPRVGSPIGDRPSAIGNDPIPVR